MQPIFRDNIQATTEYLKILVDIKAYLPLTEIVHPEMLDDMFHRFNNDFGRHDRDNPIAMLEYIRLLNELNKYYPLKRKFKGDFMEESFHRLIKDMRHYMRDDSYSAFEYLRLLNELGQYYPMRKMHPEFFEEAIHIITKDIKHFARKDPQGILEFLKLLFDLSEHFPIKEKFPQEIFIESMLYITAEWENIFRENHNQFNLLEYLKIISEFSKRLPIEKFVPHDLLRDAIHRLSKDLVYIIRNNPKEAQEYLQVVKQLYKHYPRRQQRFKEKMMDEPFFRMSKEMDMEFRDNPSATLTYLELLLINREYYQGDREEHMIERIVDTFRKRDYPSSVLAKAAVVLIQYEAPSSLIESLFDNHPKFRNLFSNSPELAREVLEATAELNNHERFN